MLSCNPVLVHLSLAGQGSSSFWTGLEHSQKAEGFAVQELHLAVQGIRAPVPFFSGGIIQEE